MQIMLNNASSKVSRESVSMSRSLKAFSSKENKQNKLKLLFENILAGLAWNG